MRHLADQKHSCLQTTKCPYLAQQWRPPVSLKTLWKSFFICAAFHVLRTMWLQWLSKHHQKEQIRETIMLSHTILSKWEGNYDSDAEFYHTNTYKTHFTGCHLPFHPHCTTIIYSWLQWATFCKLSVPTSRGNLLLLYIPKNITSLSLSLSQKLSFQEYCGSGQRIQN